MESPEAPHTTPHQQTVATDALWRRTAPATAHLPALQGALTADVAIIGGGYSGLSAALHLAEAGFETALIEAHEPGAGASGRNAAGWLPTYLDQTPSAVERRLGVARGHALNRMVAESARLVPRIVARHSLAVDLKPSGIFVGSGRPAQAGAARALAREWMGCGGNVHVVDTSRSAQITGTDRFSHGLVFADGGTLNPLAYARGLATAAVTAGARLFGGEAATGADQTTGGWRVRTSSGHVDARHILIATEGHDVSPHLWPGLSSGCYRLPMAVITSKPVPDLLARLMPAGQPIADTNKANPFWMMADRDGRLVLSLLPPRENSASLDTVARPLNRKLGRLHPGLPAIPWSHYWMGTVAVSAERIPCLRPLAEGAYAIGGYSGQGIGAATAAGQEFARLIASGGDERACRLPLLPLKPLPFRHALPWAYRQILSPLGRWADVSYRRIPAPLPHS